MRDPRARVCNDCAGKNPNGPSGEETCLWGAVSFDGAWGGPCATGAAASEVTAMASGCGANPQAEGRVSGLKKCPCPVQLAPCSHHPPACGFSWAGAGAPGCCVERVGGAAVPQEGTQALPRIQPPAFPEEGAVCAAGNPPSRQGGNARSHLWLHDQTRSAQTEFTLGFSLPSRCVCPREGGHGAPFFTLRCPAEAFPQPGSHTWYGLPTVCVQRGAVLSPLPL